MKVQNSVGIALATKGMSAKQLGLLLDTIKNEIQRIQDDLNEDEKPHRRLYTSRERYHKKSVAIAYCETYEEVYEEWELKTKQEYIRRWLDTNPIIKKYKDLGIIQ
jgi:hypothetical protein